MYGRDESFFESINVTSGVCFAKDHGNDFTGSQSLIRGSGKRKRRVWLTFGFPSSSCKENKIQRHLGRQFMQSMSPRLPVRM